VRSHASLVEQLLDQQPPATAHLAEQQQVHVGGSIKRSVLYRHRQQEREDELHELGRQGLERRRLLLLLLLVRELFLILLGLFGSREGTVRIVGVEIVFTWRRVSRRGGR